MFRFLFNSMRTRKPLAVLLLLALGLALPFSASAGKKKKADTTAAPEVGPRKFPFDPNQAGVAKPAQHRARTLARLFCRSQDRLHSGSQCQAQGNAGWTALPAGSPRRKNSIPRRFHSN